MRDEIPRKQQTSHPHGKQPNDFFLSPHFSRSEIKSEGYGVDAMDGGMRGGGFGYKKAANRRGLMKRSDQLKRRTDRRQAAWVSR